MDKALIIYGVKGGAFHLKGDDIDTDRIIPARFLKCVTFEGLGENVFKDDRLQAGGEHPFDDAENLGREVLVVDQNFASGSSREHAVPALTQFGIKAIIGRSFSAIFSGNAVGNGLICVTVDEKSHDELLDLVGQGSEVEINLDAMRITLSGSGSATFFPCYMPESHRDKLTTGTWDDIATCLDAGEAVDQTAASLPYFL